MQTAWSISELNRYMGQLIDSDHKLRDLWVVGEISNFKAHTSGHLYFSLKDEDSSVRAVMFRGKTRNLAFRPENGLKVMVRCQVSVYPRDGNYQLYVQEMEPAGLGGIYLKLEQTKLKLEKEGLFAAERKKPLPLLPKAVGLVTAAAGAAVQDMLNIIRRRFPNMSVVLAPALVQGEGAAASLIEALQRLDNAGLVDVIILGRGGGSREDLWAFNDELLCRTIAACKTPVVSAVGHETDTSLTDYVADLRAPTPSAAAEIVVPDKRALQEYLENLQKRLTFSIKQICTKQRILIDGLSRRPSLTDPLYRLRAPRQRVDELSERLERLFGPQRFGRLDEQIEVLSNRLQRAMINQIQLKKNEFGAISGKLNALSPLAILQRGYAVCFDAEGNIIRSSKTVDTDNQVEVLLAEGMLKCKVVERREKGQHG